MKKLLRFLIGGKAKAASPMQTRIEPAHELAMKAVVRRRGENAKIEARSDAAGVSRSPVIAKQIAPTAEGVIRRNGGQAASTLPAEERRTAIAGPGRASPVEVPRKARHQLADIAMYGRVAAKPVPKAMPEPKPKKKHRLADIGGALG